MTWERLPIDPNPGPARPTRSWTHRLARACCSPARRRARSTARCSPSPTWRVAGRADTCWSTSGSGPRASRTGSQQAPELDLLVFVDVGGDVLGDGTEPGLASPLCDAVMLAAGALLQRAGEASLAAVFGPCCDGELTPEELLGPARAAGGRRRADRREAITPRSPTSSSGRSTRSRPRPAPRRCAAPAARSGRPRSGGGRRTVPLSPIGATTVYFDADRAVNGTRLARVVLDAQTSITRRAAARDGVQDRARLRAASAARCEVRAQVVSWIETPRCRSPPGTSRPRRTTRSPCSRTSRHTATASRSCSRGCPATSP